MAVFDFQQGRGIRRNGELLNPASCREGDPESTTVDACRHTGGEGIQSDVQGEKDLWLSPGGSARPGATVRSASLVPAAAAPGWSRASAKDTCRSSREIPKTASEKQQKRFPRRRTPTPSASGAREEIVPSHIAAVRGTERRGVLSTLAKKGAMREQSVPVVVKLAR